MTLTGAEWQEMRNTVGDHPGLRTLAWQTDAGTTITETAALNLYEARPHSVRDPVRRPFPR